jgi:hypothetical protein
LARLILSEMDDVESRFPWNCLVSTGGGHVCPRKLMSNNNAWYDMAWFRYDVIFI